MTRRLYATDASVYQEIPAAVAMPRNAADVENLIQLARELETSLIPRTAGTSLAGQVVGPGIVVDVSRYMNSIIEIDAQKSQVRLEPGVIRNELNQALQPHGLLFGPETSTANRAMIGGMLGNNSCGANSIVYGTTRDQVLEISGYFSDGSAATLGEIDRDSVTNSLTKSKPDRLDRVIRFLWETLSDESTRANILENFPDPAVTRRNTGYALDLMARSNLFETGGPPLNLAQLVAGSEGTLFFATEIKLRCQPLPPQNSALIAAHFESVDQALRANLIAMKFRPFASELIDQMIIQGASRNLTQKSNLDFIKESPAAILMIQLREWDEEWLETQTSQLVRQLQTSQLGYHFPVLKGEQQARAWELRKAGLGVVANVPGDAKPVTVIEDTAVSIEQLPQYIAELDQILKDEFGFQCVHYGHAGSGELHLRPLINLKTAKGQQQFSDLASRVADLVKKYRGSLSGEHGDGRLRAPFLKRLIGDENYHRLRQLKQVFDPEYRFNPGKIIDPEPLTKDTRYDEFLTGDVMQEPSTLMDFSSTGGIRGAAELCSGSGDCRKTELTGGTMCPSYMATRDEKDSTRARANLLRQAMSQPTNLDWARQDDVREVLDLCLSCKGCKSECPSNVDIAKLKAEFSYADQKSRGIPMRSRLFAHLTVANRINSVFPWFYNFLASNRLTSSWMKSLIGIHPQRPLPKLSRTTLRKWFARREPARISKPLGTVELFCDEFTDFHDLSAGQATVRLLETLGYQVKIPRHEESGRAAISKGLLERAQKVAIRNVELLGSPENQAVPLIGIEPSAILTLRDEYLDLVPNSFRAPAERLAARSQLLEEFLVGEWEQGRISSETFTAKERTIHLHGHCHQKALASLKPTIQMLQLPKNFRVRQIPSGCCGMAGSFGYEREHYDLSLQIAELVLFPKLREMDPDDTVAATGISCRHQIQDGLGIQVRHPAEILFDAIESRNP